MPLPRARPLRVRDQHRRSPIVVFVCRQPDDMFWVSTPQIVDLIELKLVIFGGVEAHTMIDRYRNRAAFEERDDVIEGLLGCATRRDDDRAPRGCDLLEERPIVDVGTRHLDDRKIKLDTAIDGGFV